MGLSIEMSFAEAKRFFQTAQVAPQEKITLSFDETCDNALLVLEQLRQERALKALQSFRGAGTGGLLDELLKERQHDRATDC